MSLFMPSGPQPIFQYIVDASLLENLLWSSRTSVIGLKIFNIQL